LPSYHTPSTPLPETPISSFTLERLLKTINEISSETGVHATQINTWKKQAREGLKEIFLQKGGKKLASQDSLIDQLYQQIGRLQVELDWLKKKSGLDY
jgi:transposase-like protein